MKFLAQKIIYILCIGLFLTSCNKENIDQTIAEDPVFEPELVEVNSLFSSLKTGSTTQEGLFLSCVTIKYPFEMALESGSTTTINSDSDFESAVTAESPNQVVDFVFPLNIIDDKDIEAQVADNQELGVKFGSCIPTTGWETFPEEEGSLPAFLLENSCCFGLVYPVNLEDTAGNSYTATDESELINLMATVEGLIFSLPLTVSLIDGSELVINSIEEFYNALYNCEEIAPPVDGDGGVDILGDGCGALLFPFSVQTADGVIIINDENEYTALILSGVESEITFPFTLAGPDGESFVINSPEQKIEVLVACGLIVIEDPDPCNTPAHVLLMFNQGMFCGYSVNYPFQAEAEETVYDIESNEDYFALYNQYQFNIDKIDLIYPVNVTISEDGSTSTFENDDDVCSFIQECE